MIVNRKPVYYPVLDIPEGTSGAFAVRHVIRPAGEALPIDNMRTATFTGRPPRTITFDTETRWHALTEDGGVWMTDDPIEQAQHDRALAGFRGDVLVGGLGLGYAVTALSRMRGVKTITVVERSDDVCDLVWPHVKTKKMSLLRGDLFEYVDHCAGRRPSFDFGFFDIWQSDGERTLHETIVPLRARSVGLVEKLVCWNEDVMRGQLVWSLISSLLFEVHGGPDVNLDSLATRMPKSRASVYHNWKVPFWRWYIAARPDLPTARRIAAIYARWYGRPEMADSLRNILRP